MIDHLMSQSVSLLREKNLLGESLTLFVHDITNEHSDRWRAFVMLDNLGELECDSCSYSNFDGIVGTEVFMYDGIVHADRYQTINLLKAIETIVKRTEEEGKNTPNLRKKLESQLMEDMLGSFYFDW